MSTDNSTPNPFRDDSTPGTENPFRENPYLSPTVPGGGQAGYGLPSGRGMVGHVMVVSILMIVQGALEALVGGGLVVLGAVFPTMMQAEMRRGGGPPGGPSPEAMSWIMLAVYGGLGLLVLLGAVLHIWAGISNLKFRRRTLGIVALGVGLVSTFTCYCAPTSIALAVYGLVVYLSPQVAQAFTMGQAGKTRAEIDAAFR
jgi:hypothetical protein